MPCACNSGKPAAAKSSYVVTAPGGTKKTYSTEVEAAAAAKRVGGTYRKS